MRRRRGLRVAGLLFNMADAIIANPTSTPARPGVITLARHGEPALSRKVRLNAPEYGDWWARYEEGGLKAGQAPPSTLIEIAREAGVVIASTRLRSIETARAVVGDRAFATDPTFIEAPLPPPPWPLWLRMSPKRLGFFARFWWWFFDNHGGQETRKQAEARAGQAADLLIALAENGQDVLVLAHGFFNWMIADALKARGWAKIVDEGHAYWSIKRFRRA
ncbi:MULTISPECIES: histidine phosphatase family protein [unclassified Caulobacter]|uniref:histidine phosphatase family protein n=1 Tax=unclassified Caulobacter TaxID=2648921 RepID=UPI000784CBF8|nr:MULTISPECIES: histidine phosphatase family protein [unclassified Caulobacter]AZS20955.1 histidine phosphatase family protein [Caulobacter sp. FWC26]